MLKKHLKYKDLFKIISIALLLRSVAKFRKIKLKKIIVQQIYHWWSIKTCKKYFCDSNQLLSSVLLLVEFNQEIIIDLDAIEIDATYRTNNMECELYTIMGVFDGTGFPLSYLLISARKGQNITAHKECSVINPNWRVTNNSERVFCPLNFWETVIKLVNQYLNYHMLLPKLNGTFIADANEI
ncbi:unnamed protein product [Rhizophagus irregularis]|nr:unnamed protein product [Rhizophagus irregularis]